jgi:hypothetical protein
LGFSQAFALCPNQYLATSSQDVPKGIAAHHIGSEQRAIAIEHPGKHPESFAPPPV